MKKLLFNVCFMGIALLSYSQDQQKEKSKAETFSGRSGTLIQQEFEEAGTVKKVEFEVVRYKDLISEEKTNALRISYVSTSTYTSDTKVAILDADEVDGLIKSLQIIQDKIFITTPVNYTEVKFKSRSGFSAGCYNDDKKWKVFLKIEQFDSKSNVFFNQEDLPELLNILKKAKEKL